MCGVRPDWAVNVALGEGGRVRAGVENTDVSQ